MQVRLFDAVSYYHLEAMVGPRVLFRGGFSLRVVMGPYLLCTRQRCRIARKSYLVLWDGKLGDYGVSLYVVRLMVRWVRMNGEDVGCDTGTVYALIIVMQRFYFDYQILRYNPSPRQQIIDNDITSPRIHLTARSKQEIQEIDHGNFQSHIRICICLASPRLASPLILTAITNNTTPLHQSK